MTEDQEHGQNGPTDHTKNSQEGLPLGNTSLTKAIDPITPSEGDDTGKDPDNPPKWTKDRNFIIQVLIFIVGVIVAFIYYCQLNKMTESNTINRQSLEAVQRAFITFARIDPQRGTLFPRSGDMWDIRVSFENSGATPAVAVIQYTEMEKLSSEPNETAILGRATSFQPNSVGPKGILESAPISDPESYIFGTDFGPGAMTDEKVERIRSTYPDGYLNKNPLFVWGWVGYRDIFDDPHVTEYCMRFYRFAIFPSTHEIKWDFTACPDYNCTDKYCGESGAAIEKLIPAIPTKRTQPS